MSRMPVGLTWALLLLSAVSPALPQTLVGLRIADENGIGVTAVNINTDQTKYLRVQGQWSDKPGQWVDFPALWGMNPLIPSANAMPTTDATNWTFSPTVPGEADLSVRNQSGTQTKTVHVVVTPAPPSRVEISLIDNDPRAGTPFRARVKVYNTDGLIPGLWCHPGNGRGQVAYQDMLGKSGQYPVVSMDLCVRDFGPGPERQRDTAVCQNFLCHAMSG